MRVMQVLE